MRTLHPDMLAQFYKQFPLSQSLHLVPVVINGDGYADLFDIRDVEGLLGSQRFLALMEQVKHQSALVSCGHDTHPMDHADENLRGVEVHCVCAQDIESFLKGGG